MQESPLQDPDGGRRLYIIDHAGLTAVVQWARARGMNSVAEPTMSKLRNARQAMITMQVYVRFQDFIEEELARAEQAGDEASAEEAYQVLFVLGHAIFSPTVVHVVVPDYQSWIQERLERFIRRTGSSVRLVNGQVQRIPLEEDAREMYALPADENGVAGTMDESPIVYHGGAARRARLLTQCVARMHAECAQAVKAFETSAERAGHEERIAVSLIRIAEPLAEMQESGGIERDGLTMPAGEFRAYVRHALKAEAVLLNRAPFLQLAQQLSPIIARRVRNARRPPNRARRPKPLRNPKG